MKILIFISNALATVCMEASKLRAVKKRSNEKVDGESDDDARDSEKLSQLSQSSAMEDISTGRKISSLVANIQNLTTSSLKGLMTDLLHGVFLFDEK